MGFPPIVPAAGAPASTLAKTFLTIGNDLALLPNSRRVLAGTGITFDDTVAGIRTINGSGGAAVKSLVSAGQVLTAAYADSDLQLVLAAGSIVILDAMLIFSGITTAQAAFAQHAFPAGFAGPVANIYRTSVGPTISDSTLDATSQLNVAVGAGEKKAIICYSASFLNGVNVLPLKLQVKSQNGTGQLDAGSWWRYQVI